MNGFTTIIESGLPNLMISSFRTPFWDKDLWSCGENMWIDNILLETNWHHKIGAYQ